MNSIIASMVAVAGLIISGYSLAVNMPEEGKAKCGTCHAIDKSSAAPSFMEISNKYKGDKDAVSKIATSITMGVRLAGSLEKCQQKAWGQMMLKSSLFQSLLLIWQNKLGHCKISL